MNNIIKHRKRLTVVSLLLNNEGQGMPRKLMGTLGVSLENCEHPVRDTGHPAWLRGQAASTHHPRLQEPGQRAVGHLPDDQIPLLWVVNERYLARKELRCTDCTFS